jgi:hypothetical protein
VVHHGAQETNSWHVLLDLIACDDLNVQQIAMGRGCNVSGRPRGCRGNALILRFAGLIRFRPSDADSHELTDMPSSAGRDKRRTERGRPIIENPAQSARLPFSFFPYCPAPSRRIEMILFRSNWCDRPLCRSGLIPSSCAFRSCGGSACD